ncbi:hypothetical protein [Rhodococcus koreensis]
MHLLGVGLGERLHADSDVGPIVDRRIELVAELAELGGGPQLARGHLGPAQVRIDGGRLPEQVDGIGDPVADRGDPRYRPLCFLRNGGSTCTSVAAASAGSAGAAADSAAICRARTRSASDAYSRGLPGLFSLILWIHPGLAPCATPEAAVRRGIRPELSREV